MKIKIEIECDTIMQIKQHLHVINLDINKERKRQQLNQYEDDFPKPLQFGDSNCYGEHYVKIRP